MVKSPECTMISACGKSCNRLWQPCVSEICKIFISNAFFADKDKGLLAQSAIQAETIPLLYIKVRHVEDNFAIYRSNLLNPNRSLDFGEIARLCHAACFSPSRRRSGLRRGVARIRMRTEAGKMPESLIFPIKNRHGVSNDRFGLKLCLQH